MKREVRPFIGSTLCDNLKRLILSRDMSAMAGDGQMIGIESSNLIVAWIQCGHAPQIRHSRRSHAVRSFLDSRKAKGRK